MNRNELIKQISKRTGKAKDDVDEILTAFEGIVGDTLTGGGEVRIKGFGRFFIKRTSPRNVRNPVTGELRAVQSRGLPAFKFSTYIIERVKKGVQNG